MTAEPEVTHMCPPDSIAFLFNKAGIMPCCGRTPFEVGRMDRITNDAALVTCKGIKRKEPEFSEDEA